MVKKYRPDLDPTKLQDLQIKLAVKENVQKENLRQTLAAAGLLENESDRKVIKMDAGMQVSDDKEKPRVESQAIDAQTEFIDEIKSKYELEKGKLLEDFNTLKYEKTRLERENKDLEHRARTQPVQVQPEPQRRPAYLDEADELFENMPLEKSKEVAALFKLMRQTLKEDQFEREGSSIADALGISSYLDRREKRERDSSNQ